MTRTRPATPLRDYLRQITYGGNDGIITTFAIVAGFAGAQAQGVAGLGVLAILIFGFANLTADGVSMGLGEFLSGRSARDVYQSRFREVVAAIRRDPAAVTDRLATHLARQGLGADEARHTAEHLATAPELMADLTLRYEDGLEAPDGHNPLLRALMTFLAFIAFGLIPILPYLVAPQGARTFAVSVGATVLALALLGLLRFAATRESLLRALAETLVLGGLCATVAYLAGMAMAALG